MTKKVEKSKSFLKKILIFVNKQKRKKAGARGGPFFFLQGKGVFYSAGSYFAIPTSR